MNGPVEIYSTPNHQISQLKAVTDLFFSLMICMFINFCWWHTQWENTHGAVTLNTPPPGSEGFWPVEWWSVTPDDLASTITQPEPRWQSGKVSPQGKQPTSGQACAKSFGAALGKAWKTQNTHQTSSLDLSQFMVLTEVKIVQTFTHCLIKVSNLSPNTLQAREFSHPTGGNNTGANVQRYKRKCLLVAAAQPFRATNSRWPPRYRGTVALWRK